MLSASVVNAFKLFKKGSTNQIAAQVTYDAETHTATLNPTNNLKRGATYKAVVTTVAKDEAGNRLDQNDSGAGLRRKKWFFKMKTRRALLGRTGSTKGFYRLAEERGVARPRSSAFYISPYSPKCVEGQFSELRVTAF